MRILRITQVLLILLALPLAEAEAAVPNQDPIILHFLNRVSFGPAPGDIDTVRQIGFETYIEQQLHPDLLPQSPALTALMSQHPLAGAPLDTVVRQFQPPVDEGKLSEEDRKVLGQRLNLIGTDMTEQKIIRAVLSPAQLQEVMVDFWYNHFNVFWGKGLDRVYASTYERDAIRPYVFGKFRDLLEATARHPAMLVYLDNWQNTDPNSLAARKVSMHGGQPPGINENYAREIMELHTLGVDGGYTQQDVTSLAHILTGWGLGRGKDWSDKDSFMFDPSRHDFSNKSFLGYTVRGSGADEIDAVLDALAADPHTAHHIAFELAQYFVADEPPATLVTRLQQTFTGNHGDIAGVLRVLFKSPEFWDPKYRQAKFKPPFRYVVSALRASGGVLPQDLRQVQGELANMGEPLYRCQTPNGYANTNDQWLNSDALLKRAEVANKYAHTVLNDRSASMIYGAYGPQNWSANTIKAVTGAAPPLRATLLLSSPEFLYY